MRTAAELTADIRAASRCVLVVNTRSRRAAHVHPRLAPALARAGVRLLADLPVTDPATLSRTLEHALGLEPDLVIVGGGDGTLATAVDHLVHRDVALGVLPLGTTNNAARSLGLPLTLHGAVRTIATGEVADVDLGRLHTEGGHDVFANLVSLGLSVEVARATPHLLKRRLGRAAYALTALRLLPGHAPFTATVTGPDGERRLRTHQLNVANGSHHAGRPIARDATVDDARLTVYPLGGPGRLSLVGAAVAQALLGARRTVQAETFLSAQEVRVSTEPPLEVDVDGEVVGTTPITVSVDPGALRIVVPARPSAS